MRSDWMTEYPWPPVPGCSDQGRPVWTGRGFKIRDAVVPVLSYDVGVSGWTDELTRFHEATAGSSHFIDRASRQHALEQLDGHVRGLSPVVLDVGCSSGFLLRQVRERFPHACVMGSDYLRGPLEKLAADMPDVPLLQFDLVECPLPEDSIDAVVLLNVLEHIEDDAAAVRQVHRILKPGGVVVIEVPAGPHLYDVYDKLLLHCRRYSLAGLRRLVLDARFEIIEQSHLGFLLYPGFWLVKKRGQRFTAEREVVQRQVVAKSIRETGNSRLLEAIMRIELMFGRWISYPFGVRCLLTCAKGG